MARTVSWYWLTSRSRSNAGGTRATSKEPMASTTSNSISVKPRRCRSGGVADIGVFTFAARYSVSAIRNNFNAAVCCRAGVFIGLSPGVVGHGAFEIRAIPAVDRSRAVDQGVKAFGRAGKASDVQFE